MTEEQVLDFASEAVFALLKISAPIMLIGLAVGLTIAIFQALTQVQEVTLTFVPKIIVIFIALIPLLPFMLEVLQTFMTGVADRIISLE